LLRRVFADGLSLKEVTITE